MTKDNLVYIKHVRDAIATIQDYTNGMSYDEFIADQKTRDAVVRQLEIIGEAVSNTSADFRKLHDGVPWRDISAMRNKLIHEYFGVDEDTVWQVIKEDVPELNLAIEKLLQEDE